MHTTNSDCCRYRARYIFVISRMSDIQLHAWVVMPNHFHVLFETLHDGWTMAKIVASWKKYTARRIRDYLKNATPEEAFPSANQEIGDPHMAETLKEGRTSANREIVDPHMPETLKEGRTNANREIVDPHMAETLKEGPYQCQSGDWRSTQGRNSGCNCCASSPRDGNSRQCFPQTSTQACLAPGVPGPVYPGRRTLPGHC